MSPKIVSVGHDSEEDDCPDTQPAPSASHYQCSCGRIFSESEYAALPSLGWHADPLFFFDMTKCPSCSTSITRLQGPSWRAIDLSPSEIAEEWSALQDQAAEAERRGDDREACSISAELEILRELLVEKVGEKETDILLMERCF